MDPAVKLGKLKCVLVGTETTNMAKSSRTELKWVLDLSSPQEKM